MGGLYRGSSIRQLSLHRRRSLWTRLDVTPWVVGYGLGVTYVGSQWDGLDDHDMFGLFGLALLALAHLLYVLLCYWLVGVGVTARYSSVTLPRLAEAECVYAVPPPNKGESGVCPLVRETGGGGAVHFVFQQRVYEFDVDEGAFRRRQCLDQEPLGRYAAVSSGYATQAEVEAAKERWGHNLIDIPLRPFWDMYKEQALAPFFVFQVFCMLLWCLDEYWYYSVFTLCMLLVFEGTVVKSRLRNLQLLRDMIRPPQPVEVYRGKAWITVSSADIVPGDLCLLRGKDEFVCPADVVLLSGQVVVNEAMLTGESTPLLKEALHVDDDNASERLRTSGTHRTSIVFGGTTILQQSTDKGRNKRMEKLTKGCVGYVIRTGYETTQGKLMRTILYSAQRVTANTWETGLFILILLCFAVVAAGYILVESMNDPSRSRYKTILECTLVLTSVVPPELPMELSLAINTSLQRLNQKKIFCTEPFRIPLAGKASVCCFDKTGTLTSDEIILEGAVGVQHKSDGPCSPDLVPANAIPPVVGVIAAGCHSLTFMKNRILGDPIEIAALEGLGWSVTGVGDTVVKRSVGRVTVINRYHFSADLKRMSTVGLVDWSGGGQGQGAPIPMALVKGAPEVIRDHLASVPTDYDQVFQRFAREGSRVLALAQKTLPKSSADYLRGLSRKDVEDGLTFGGFLVFRCPIKPQSPPAIQDLRDSSHRVVMITGDNPLTAVYVSASLNIVTKPTLFLRCPEDGGTVGAVDAGGAPVECSLPGELSKLAEKYDFCMDGPAMDGITRRKSLAAKGTYSVAAAAADLAPFLPYTTVFARASPEQKETVILGFNLTGSTTLMCGDGTNDVGALRQAHVGVAILSTSSVGDSARPAPAAPASSSGSARPSQKPVTATRLAGRRRQAKERLGDKSSRAKSLMEQLEKMDDDSGTITRLGDASFASPFTAKSSSIDLIGCILQQGRCTLVTTYQMMRILALNCIVSAYSLSVLYVDGVKLGDTQATIAGLGIAMFFLFLSRSRPVEYLSKYRPPTRLFSPSIMLSIAGQIVAHMAALVFVVGRAREMHQTLGGEAAGMDDDFSPDVVNSAVFLIMVWMQITTFFANYQGKPFMESLLDNRGLLGALAAAAGLIILMVLEVSVDLNESMELSPMPWDLREAVLLAMAFDLVVCSAWEFGVRYLSMFFT
mmetsp:Transcript_35535/g.100081  ORF Transcript_35535/g.100081 Transcript_35535/m.100081 type:complete len:1179 (-) Transcript_35535:1429-4965(-)